VWLVTYKVIPSAYEYPNYDGDAVWQRWYTIAAFGLSILAAALLTYGFEHPVAKRLQSAWNRRRQKGNA